MWWAWPEGVDRGGVEVWWAWPEGMALGTLVWWAWLEGYGVVGVVRGRGLRRSRGVVGVARGAEHEQRPGS